MIGSACLRAPMMATARRVRGHVALDRVPRTRSVGTIVDPGNRDAGARLDAGRVTTDIGGKGDASRAAPDRSK